MKRIYLFPNKLKIPALVVFLIALVLIILQFNEISLQLNMKVFAVVSDPFLDSENSGNFRWVEQDMYDEILDFLFFTSGIVLAFSKEKIEDEMIGLLRYKSLTYATYFIFSSLIISEFLIYGMSYGYVIFDFLFFSNGIGLGFSKEKIGEGMIGFVRYKSLTYATYFIFCSLIISEFLIYGMAYGYVNMFFFYAFILFLNIFYYTKLFIYKKQFSHENED